MECCFGSVVNRAEDVRYDAGNRADIDNEAFRGDEEGQKSLCYKNDRKEVGFEGLAYFRHIDIGRRYSVVSSSVLHHIVSQLSLYKSKIRDANALFTRISSFPPVSSEISFFAARMLSLSLTSKLNVLIPNSSKSAMELRLRAVAMTCSPLA